MENEGGKQVYGGKVCENLCNKISLCSLRLTVQGIEKFNSKLLHVVTLQIAWLSLFTGALLVERKVWEVILVES